MSALGLYSILEEPPTELRARDVLPCRDGAVMRLRKALEEQEGAAEYASISGNEEIHDSVVANLMRRNRALGPAQAAAAAGRVWWLERCNANDSCRSRLLAPDARGDTTLHHCARTGQTAACRALLRMGVDAARRNHWGLAPEHLAAQEGYDETALKLRHGRRGEPGRYHARHFDNLGVFPLSLDQAAQEGLDIRMHGSESLRHAVNLAVGHGLLGPSSFAMKSQALNYLPKGSREEDWAIHHLDEVLRQWGYYLDLISSVATNTGDSFSSWWLHAPENLGPHLRGILLFEPAGAISEDAPGHWIALRWMPLGGCSATDDVDRKGRFWRLDPVRGPFELADSEAMELLLRYRGWRIIGPPAGSAVEHRSSLLRVPPPPPPKSACHLGSTQHADAG